MMCVLLGGGGYVFFFIVFLSLVFLECFDFYDKRDLNILSYFVMDLKIVWKLVFSKSKLLVESKRATPPSGLAGV